ncbi:MAG: hypothetical protein LBV09_01895 [Deferribacteraceae bacterium]|jgi:hypothetical protein|nr:hypothetical protein [Deferribacteraceae bacterium]
MDICSARFLMSNGRMRTYEIIAYNTQKDPVDLYLLNTEASASFHFPLNICEVLLRNVIDRILSAKFTENWHTNPQFHRMIDKYHRDKLSSSIDKYANKGDVITNLSLSFWVNLLSPKYANIWKNCFYSSFLEYKAVNPRSNNPENALNAVYNQLKRINKLRNRIAHYEPIINKNIAVEYKQMLNVISYINADCAEWVQAKQQTEHYIKCIADL